MYTIKVYIQYWGQMNGASKKDIDFITKELKCSIRHEIYGKVYDKLEQLRVIILRNLHLETDPMNIATKLNEILNLLRPSGA